MNTSSLPFMNSDFQGKNVFNMNQNAFHVTSPSGATPGEHDYKQRSQDQIPGLSSVHHMPSTSFVNGLASPVSPSNFYTNDVEKLNHVQPADNFVFPIRTMNISGPAAPQSASLVQDAQHDMMWGPMSAPLSNMFVNFLDMPFDQTSPTGGSHHQFSSAGFNHGAHALHHQQKYDQIKNIPVIIHSSDKRGRSRNTQMKYTPYEHDSMNSLPSLTASSHMDMSLSAGSMDESRPFICPYPECGKTFAKQFNLKSHLRIHTTGKNFHCQECDASFRRPHDLQRHIRSIHIRSKPYSCSICSKCFARTDALKRHNSRVTSACYIPRSQESPTPEQDDVDHANSYSDIPQEHQQSSADSSVGGYNEASYDSAHSMPSHYESIIYSPQHLTPNDSQLPRYV